MPFSDSGDLESARHSAARNVALTSSFNGTEILIFGAIVGSQHPSAAAGYYGVIVVVEGSNAN